VATPDIAPVVDADGQVLEPVNTWQKYIDPQFRDRAVRLEHDENGWEILLFDNKPVEVTRGTLGALGGVGSEADRRKVLGTNTLRLYAIDV